MSTSRQKPPLDTALSRISPKFRARIVKAYLETKRRHARAAFDSSYYDAIGLSAGKFCEGVLRFLQNELTSTHIAFGVHIPNFIDECQKLTRLPATAGNESLRITIPRALEFVWTLRGKRGIGHVAGDVEANAIDSATIVRVCDWIICEFVRIYHQLSLEDAQDLVDTISTRSLPYIWEVAGKKRVLKSGLDYKQKTLLLAYSEPQGWVLSEDLFLWTKHSNLPVYKAQVLVPLDKAGLIEYDRKSQIVYISPLGIREVEEVILKAGSAD